MRYIALLRGVNVSGKNKIAMKELKATLRTHGYQNVISLLVGALFFIIHTYRGLNKSQNVAMDS